MTLTMTCYIFKSTAGFTMTPNIVEIVDFSTRSSVIILLHKIQYSFYERSSPITNVRLRTNATTSDDVDQTPLPSPIFRLIPAFRKAASRSMARLWVNSFMRDSMWGKPSSASSMLLSEDIPRTLRTRSKLCRSRPPGFLCLVSPSPPFLCRALRLDFF